ncbi:MAG: hypothetical protein O3A00_03630 [Planctomycetota bacterium]|nr:hypothetical protein [Planctomycetota bacterium]
MLSICICLLGFLGCEKSSSVGTSAKSDELSQELALAMARLKSLERKQASMQADLFPIYQIKPQAEKAVTTVQQAVQEVKSVMADLTSAQGQLMAAQKEIEALKERVTASEKAIEENKKSVTAALKVLQDKDVELGKQDATIEAALKSVEQESIEGRKALAEKDASLDKQDIAILTMMKAVEETAKQVRVKLMGNVNTDDPAEVKPKEAKAQKPSASPTPTFDVMLRTVEQAAKEERLKLNQKDAALDQKDVAIEAELKKVEGSAKAERSKLAEKDQSLDRQDLAILTVMQTVEETARLERLKLIEDAKPPKPGVKGDAVQPAATADVESAAAPVTFNVLLRAVERAAKEERSKLHQRDAELDRSDASITAILKGVETTARAERTKLAEKDALLEKRDIAIEAMLNVVESAARDERLKLARTTDILNQQDVTMLVMLQDVEGAAKAERLKSEKDAEPAKKPLNDAKDALENPNPKKIGNAKSPAPKTEPQTFETLLQAVKAAATAERVSSARAFAELVAQDKLLLAKLQASEKAAMEERAKLHEQLTKLSEQDVSILNLVKSLAEVPTRRTDDVGKPKDEKETRSDGESSTDNRFTTSNVLSVIEVAVIGCSSVVGVPFSTALHIADSSRLVSDDDKPGDVKSKPAQVDNKKTATPKTAPPKEEPSKPDSFEQLLEKVKKTATDQRKAQQDSSTKLKGVIRTLEGLEGEDRGIIKQIALHEKRLDALEQITVIKTELAAERGRTTDLVTRVKSLEDGGKLLKTRLDALAAIGNNKKDPAIIAAGELLVRRVTVVDAESNPILVLDGSDRVPSIAFHPKDARKRVSMVPGLVSGGLAIESRNGRFLFLNR